MTYDPTSIEGRLGAATECRAAGLLRERGHAVVHVFDAPSAPMVHQLAGDAVAPDLLCFRAANALWIEVKGKTAPNWRRCRPGPRWEHGIDFAHLREYVAVREATALPVWVLLYELHSPAAPESKSRLSGPPGWLAIDLVLLERIGQRRLTWPGGPNEPHRRGKQGLGGWLWARKRMTAWGDLQVRNPEQFGMFK